VDIPYDLCPNFWWPEDHTWSVSTQIDGYSTYVGGPAGLVERLLADPALEAMTANVDDPFDPSGSDGYHLLV
jgi:hypothetical protein